MSLVAERTNDPCVSVSLQRQENECVVDSIKDAYVIKEKFIQCMRNPLHCCIYILDSPLS
jgi:hypothetical protein